MSHSFMGLECVPVPLFSGWTSCRKISRSLEAAITRLGGARFGTMTSYHSVNKGPGTIWFMHDSEMGAYDRNNKPYVNIVLLYAGTLHSLITESRWHILQTPHGRHELGQKDIALPNVTQLPSVMGRGKKTKYCFCKSGFHTSIHQPGINTW